VKMSTACRMAMSGDPTRKAKRSMSRSSTMFLPTSCPTTSRRGSPTGSSHPLSGYSPPCGPYRTPPRPNTPMSAPPTVVYAQANILPSIIIYIDPPPPLPSPPAHIGEGTESDLILRRRGEGGRSFRVNCCVL
jgi:hypothetical protein